MNILRKYLPWTIRILISFLFILSAAAKLYPSPYFAITTFEVKQLYTLGFSENVAPFFSRILIGIEFALGLLLLNNNFLKRITVPATLLMLAVFTIHLTIITFFNGGSDGNCGCFGELIPMTPIQAIFKNVVAIGLLIYLLYLLKSQPDQKSNFWILTTVTFACILGVFIATFSQPTTTDISTSSVESTAAIVPIDTTMNSLKEVKVAQVVSAATKTVVTKEIANVAEAKPLGMKSGFSKYFSDVDSGTKIICLFVPGCDHCQATAKEITSLKKNDKNFPKVQILFMDEEAEKIPEFFNIAGAKYDYKIVDIIGFWKILGPNRDVPGVKLLKDGKEIKYFYGTTDNAFNGTEITKLIKENN